jgi:hypothetical protein
MHIHELVASGSMELFLGDDAAIEKRSTIPVPVPTIDLTLATIDVYPSS